MIGMLRRPRKDGSEPNAFGADESGRARAACVIPKGAAEGDRLRATGRTFKLVVGRPARFALYAPCFVGRTVLSVSGSDRIVRPT